jgi:hypothetical protein
MHYMTPLLPAPGETIWNLTIGFGATDGGVDVVQVAAKYFGRKWLNGSGANGFGDDLSSAPTILATKLH